jgi:hypothetical protein
MGMIQLTVEKFELQNPLWSAPIAGAGDTLTLSVEAPYITSAQSVEFRIERGAELIDVITGKPGAKSVQWKAPNLVNCTNPGVRHQLKFRALLREKPSPANGHLPVLHSVQSGNLALGGFVVQMGDCDPCFVPKQEKLNITYTINDRDSAAKAGRYEIWGERYPGASPQPLYVKDFTPSAGQTTWNDWDGKANQGHLSGKYITPEFSPFRVRVIIGTDSGAVKDPYGAGQDKVAAAEKTFQVVVHSLNIRLMEGFKDKASKDEHKLENVLVIQPRQQDGTYADHGRLPKSAAAQGAAQPEVGRIRVPMARHHARTGEDVDQGTTWHNLNPAPPPDQWVGIHTIADAYGQQALKFDIDRLYYVRPELPIEFEPRLKSRNNTINVDRDQRGLFEKEAIGPLKIEPIVEEYYDATRFPDGVLLDPTAGNRCYFKKAAFKVKGGDHQNPRNTGAGGNPANSAEYPCWQARLVVAHDGDRDFDITGFNATADCGYLANNNELTVFLTRNSMLEGFTKLERSTLANDNDLDRGWKDYREIAAGPGPSTRIRLAPNLTKANDVLWIVRTSGGITHWEHFPPGPNCHEHYGGMRGIPPTPDLSNYLRKDYSPDPGGKKDQIVGKMNGSYPFREYINLLPDAAVAQDAQERVEISAVMKGDKQGLGGALFSPSFVCGDSYVLHAWLEYEPYERSFGFVEPLPRLHEDKTGPVTIWRHLQFQNSVRMPQLIRTGVGMNVDGGAPYHGDGENMSMTHLNGFFMDAFHEWTIPDTAPIHKDINLKKYRKAHNQFSKGLPGKVPLDSNNAINNEFSRYDYYREFLPPGVPIDRINRVSNLIAAQARGTPSLTVGALVAAELNAHNADPGDAPLNRGVNAITVYPGPPDQYFFAAWGRWKDTIAYKVVDVLTPADKEPRKMNIVRWNLLHESPMWNAVIQDAMLVWREDSSTVQWEGESMGNGNSLIRAGVLKDTLFTHEMGHSTHLFHFVAGNFCWKHHDLNTPTCAMSYDWKTGFIRVPAGAVGPVAGGGMGGVAAPAEPWPLSYAGTDVEHGWPHWDTNPVSGNVEYCIRYGELRAGGVALGGLCAKCILKLCGWNDQLLPVAWSHPDLF